MFFTQTGIFLVFIIWSLYGASTVILRNQEFDMLEYILAATVFTIITCIITIMIVINSNYVTFSNEYFEVTIGQENFVIHSAKFSCEELKNSKFVCYRDIEE